MGWNDYVNAVGNLLYDLFRIWEYPTFGLLLLFVGLYFAVLLIRMFTRLFY